MNENENITKREEPFAENKEEAANMDKDAFPDLLMENRIILMS